MSKIVEIQTLAYSRGNAKDILTRLFSENLISDARISDVDIAVKKMYDEGGISILKRCELTMRTKEEAVTRVIELSNKINQILDSEVTVTPLAQTSEKYAAYVENHVTDKLS